MKLLLLTAALIISVGSEGQDTTEQLLVNDRWVFPEGLDANSVFEKNELELTAKRVIDEDGVQNFLYFKFYELEGNYGKFEIYCDTCNSENNLTSVLKKETKFGSWKFKENQLLINIVYPTDVTKPTEELYVSEKHVFLILEITDTRLSLQKVQ